MKLHKWSNGKHQPYPEITQLIELDEAVEYILNQGALSNPDCGDFWEPIMRISNEFLLRLSEEVNRISDRGR